MQLGFGNLKKKVPMYTYIVSYVFFPCFLLKYFLLFLVGFVFRAVYHNADIYLVDDIFSCVDNQTRQDIMKWSVAHISFGVVG